MAVLFIINNRRLAGWEGGDIRDIIADPNQFSSMTRLGDANGVKYPDPREPEFQKVLQAVDGVFEGHINDTLTDHGLYYADLSRIERGGWFDRNILADPARFPRTAQVGTTTYFGDTEDKWFASKGKGGN